MELYNEMDSGRSGGRTAANPLEILIIEDSQDDAATLKQIASLYLGEINNYPGGAPLRLNMRSLAAGAYPYSEPFWVVTGANPTPLVKSFGEFLTSSEGLEINEKKGLMMDGKKT